MGYAVELDFDETSTAQIAAVSEELHRRWGGAHMAGMNARPHLSLAVFDTGKPAGIEPVLAAFAAETAPFPLQFAAIGTFPGPQNVIYLAPVVTSTLLALHTDWHARLAAAGLPSLGYYRPGQWVPHCTLGMELPNENLAAAVAFAREAALFNAVTVTAVQFIEFRPIRVLCTHALAVVQH